MNKRNVSNNFAVLVKLGIFAFNNEIFTSPYTGCFSCRWPFFNARKLVPKITKQFFFQNKFYSWKDDAHYLIVLLYLATWRAAKLGIFTHFTLTKFQWCSQSINPLIYVYSISPRNSTRQSAVAEGFANANSTFIVITSANIAEVIIS